MKRSEWIQRYVLDVCNQNMWNDETAADAKHVADALEKSGVAPWDGAPVSLAPGLEWVADCERYKAETVAAVEAEREACAQIADRNDQSPWGIAKEIRARGVQK